MTEAPQPEAWREKVSELFPELSDVMSDPKLDMTTLWIELFNRLQIAYIPPQSDDNMLRRIYDFAAWCLMQPDTGEARTDPSSGAAFGLFEDIPLDKKASADLYRWISEESFRGLENIFRYHFSDEEFESFSAHFFAMKRGFTGTTSL